MLFSCLLQLLLKICFFLPLIPFQISKQQQKNLVLPLKNGVFALLDNHLTLALLDNHLTQKILNITIIDTKILSQREQFSL